MRDARTLHFFDVMWPTKEVMIQSGGLAGFFHDFFHMSVRRPYQRAPEFEFIRVLINLEGTSSKLSIPKCLIVCSSSAIQDKLGQGIFHVRSSQSSRALTIQSWNPLYELMDCISVIYQIMFIELQTFIESRLLLLQKMVIS